MAPHSIKTAATVIPGAALVLVNRAALRTGLRRPVDGWRRAAGLVLRGEASTFVLSAFGLKVPRPGPGDTERAVASAIRDFLTHETCTHVGIRPGVAEDRALPETGPRYTLRCEQGAAGPERFVPPQSWFGDGEANTSTRPLLNIVCRLLSAGSCDVWLRVNHVGADGVPMQEVLTRLEAAWGSAEDVRYPAPDEFAPLSHVRPVAGRPELGEVQAFIDFEPLLEWRSVQNARLPEPLTVAAALVWRLNRQPTFAAKYVGTTVEIAPQERLARGVGVVVAHPAAYPESRDGLAAYARDFNRQVELTRNRASGGCKTLDALAFVPAGLARTMLVTALQRGRSAFGSLGLTVIKDAKVFGAPIGDTAHADGFIAIGSMALPTAAGRKVGCITIKGDRDRIAEYPAVLHQAIAG